MWINLIFQLFIWKTCTQLTSQKDGPTELVCPDKWSSSLHIDQQLFWALTYVKSCRITLAGIKGISTFCFWLFSQSKIFSTSFDFTWKPSQLRTADSSSTLIENGRRPKEVKYKIPLFNTLSTYLQYSIKFRDYSKCKDEVFMSFTWTRWNFIFVRLY